MRKTFLAVVVAGLASFGSPQSHALQCTIDPFSDVLAGDANCSSVEWLKNRAVTLGCGGSLYCPNNNVTRIQMALFMQRLADAVVQQPVGASIVSGSLTLSPTPTPANVPCTAFVAIAAYPRTAIVRVQSSVQLGGSTPGDVGLQIVHTTDGNTTNYQGVAGHINQITSATPLTWSHVSDSVIIQIPAGQATKVGTALYSVAGNTAVATARCNLVVEVQSRTGSGTPFDEQY